MGKTLDMRGTHSCDWDDNAKAKKMFAGVTKILVDVNTIHSWDPRHYWPQAPEDWYMDVLPEVEWFGPQPVGYGDEFSTENLLEKKQHEAADYFLDRGYDWED